LFSSIHHSPSSFSSLFLSFIVSALYDQHLSAPVCASRPFVLSEYRTRISLPLFTAPSRLHAYRHKPHFQSLHAVLRIFKAWVSSDPYAHKPNHFKFNNSY
ncbi:uncharacterized protein MELLADRAFT_72097, partial [Melampsora larici-populina 98AG31]